MQLEDDQANKDLQRSQQSTRKSKQKALKNASKHYKEKPLAKKRPAIESPQLKKPAKRLSSDFAFEAPIPSTPTPAFKKEGKRSRSPPPKDTGKSKGKGKDVPGGRRIRRKDRGQVERISLRVGKEE